MNEDRSITAQLKAQVRDLQQSLKINKELMQNVLLEGITDQSVKDLIQRLEKENSRLSVALNKEHKEKIQLYEAIKKRKEQFDKDHEVMKDKEQKFDAYLKNFRKDLDERKRTIDKQAKTIDKLRPMAEKFEREGELRVRSPPAPKKDPPPTENGNKNSNTSMESVEIDEIINENEKLTKDLKKANEEIDRLRNNL